MPLTNLNASSECLCRSGLAVRIGSGTLSGLTSVCACPSEVRCLSPSSRDQQGVQTVHRCLRTILEEESGRLSGTEGSSTLIAGLIAIRLPAIAASRHWRRAKTALRIVEGEAGGGHLSYPTAYGSFGESDHWGAAEPGQHLDLQRDLELRAGGQPEVVPGLDPVGGPLLKSDLTATGIAP